MVDTTKHEEWHQYHQQQLIRMVDQIERQQKVTGKLIVRFSSVLNGKGGDDSGITVDLLAFASYWIGAGLSIGVLAWSVSERRWLPAGAMLLFALVAVYLAYREIRPSHRRSKPSNAVQASEQRTAQHSPVPGQQPRQYQRHQPQQPNQPQHQAQQQHQPPQQNQPQHQAAQHQTAQHAAPPARPASTQPSAVPAPPQYPLPSYNANSTNGQTPDNTQNGWNRRGDGWR